MQSNLTFRLEDLRAAKDQTATLNVNYLGILYIIAITAQLSDIATAASQPALSNSLSTVNADARRIAESLRAALPEDTLPIRGSQASGKPTPPRHGVPRASLRR